MSDDGRIRSIVAVSLRPSDVVILEVSGQNLPQSRVKQLHNMLSSLWPKHRILILDESTKLSVVHPNEAPLVWPEQPIA